MSIAVTATKSAIHGSDAETWYHWEETLTVPAGQDLLALFVALCTGANMYPIVDSAVFNGVAMTSLHAENFSSYYRVVAYYALAPAAGSRTCRLDFNEQADFGQTKCGGTIYILSGVHQTSPFRALASGSAASLSSITTVIDDLLIDLCVSSADTDPSGAGAGQTDIYSVPLFGSLGYGNVATSHKSPASGSESMSWSSGFSGAIRHIGVPVVPAAGGSNGFFALLGA